VFECPPSRRRRGRESLDERRSKDAGARGTTVGGSVGSFVGTMDGAGDIFRVGAVEGT